MTASLDQGVAATNSRIRETRAAHAVVTVLRPDGSALADRAVTVAQRRHRFLFGCTGFDFIPLANGDVDGHDAAAAALLAERWGRLFNFATLPFYWERFEPDRGHPDTERILTTARWFRARGVTVKGHPLSWHTLAPAWLLGLTNPEIVRLQEDRIRRDVGDFAGVIDSWDVINEVVIMPIFDRYDNGLTRIARELGRVGIVRLVFGAARASNPTAQLLINDFDVSADYERLIDSCLEAGIRFDAIGIQSHMHQGYWGVEKTLGVLERFGRFGLPLHFTETTLVSGRLMPPGIEDLNDYQVTDWPTTPDGEARQAEEVVAHYTTLLEHPAVEAITWWGLPDGGWLNAPSGLVRVDGTPKPAYDALDRLINGAWWVAPTVLRTDGDGRVRVDGFAGDYELTLDGTTTAFSLDRPGETALEIVLPA